MIQAMRDGKREFVRLLIKECIDIHKFQRSNYDRLFQEDTVSTFELFRWVLAYTSMLLYSDYMCIGLVKCAHIYI